MIFGNPLGLLLLITIPILVVLHLFRQERRRKEVSSIFLWKDISDQQSRRVRPRLLRNVNLLLQILAAIAASLALSQPTIVTESRVGSQELVLLIDDSASMAAGGDDVSRMSLATNRAREIIGRTRRDTRILLATAGPDPRVLESFTADRNRLYESLRDLSPGEGPGDIASALSLAAGLGFGETTDVILITDGAFQLPAGTAIPRNFAISFVGSDEENRGITAFELRSRPDGSAFEAYIQIANFGPTEAEVEFVLQADQEIVARRPLELGAGEIYEMALPIPRRSGTVFQGRLEGNIDALSADDQAFAVATGARPIRVQLVTQGNLFLESFLSVYPNVELSVSGSVLQAAPYDVLILDGVPAPSGLTGNIIAFGTALPDGPLEVTGVTQPAGSVAGQTSHPILRNVRLEDLRIRQIEAGELSARATVIARLADLPVIYSYRTGRLQLVGFTFSIRDSDLPLRTGFPVLMHNLLQWLAPISPAGDVGYRRVGEPIRLYVPVGEEVVIITPGGEPLRATPRSSPYQYDGAREVGIYQVRGESFSDRFAVSLADAQESDLTRRFQAAGGTTAETGAPEQTAGTPVWHWLALLALIALAVDWVVWARRT